MKLTIFILLRICKAQFLQDILYQQPAQTDFSPDLQKEIYNLPLNYRSYKSDDQESCECSCKVCYYKPKRCCKRICNKCRKEEPQEEQSAPSNIFMIPYPIPFIVHPFEKSTPDSQTDKHGMTKTSTLIPTTQLPSTNTESLTTINSGETQTTIISSRETKNTKTTRTETETDVQDEKPITQTEEQTKSTEIETDVLPEVITTQPEEKTKSTETEMDVPPEVITTQPEEQTKSTEIETDVPPEVITTQPEEQTKSTETETDVIPEVITTQPEEQTKSTETETDVLPDVITTQPEEQTKSTMYFTQFEYKNQILNYNNDLSSLTHSTSNLLAIADINKYKRERMRHAIHNNRPTTGKSRRGFPKFGLVLELYDIDDNN